MDGAFQVEAQFMESWFAEQYSPKHMVGEYCWMCGTTRESALPSRWMRMTRFPDGENEEDGLRIGTCAIYVMMDRQGGDARRRAV